MWICPTENLSVANAGDSHLFSGLNVITDKVIKGAGSHRILLALEERGRTSNDLRRMVNAVNGTARFELEYLGRLEASGFVFKDGEYWLITRKGKQKCQELGPLKPKNVATSRVPVPHVDLKSVLTMPPAIRPGSLDYQKYPSRRGNLLYYRDGRVVKLEDRDG